MAFSEAYLVIKVLFFESLGLSYTDIGIILSYTGILILLFEIPGGMISDFFGRKKSLLLSFISAFIAYIIFYYANNFWDVMFAVSFIAASWAFWSGTYESLLYETTKRLKIKSQFPKILNRINVLFIGLGVITNYYTPLLFGIDNKLPILIALLVTILVIIFGLFITEPEKLSSTKRNKEHSFIKQFDVLINIIKNDKYIQNIILFEMFFVFSIGVFGDLLNQPLISQQYELSDYAIMFSIASILQALISYPTHRYINYFSTRTFMYILTFYWFISLSLLLYFLDNMYISIILMSYVWSVGMFEYTFINKLLNFHIKDDTIRSTILSTVSMLKSLSIAIFMYIF